VGEAVKVNLLLHWNLSGDSNANNELETQNAPNSEATRRYPKRDTNKPKHLNDYILEDDSVNVTVHYCYRMHDIPTTYNEAVSSPESQNWKHAMTEEMNSLLDNDTFELVHLPEDRTVVGSRWVYAVKIGSK